MSTPPVIKRLDEVVVNRIAAGEVIQRPANALKEMIENSLDAKSTNIQILVKNGGLKLLQIQDNGVGIRKEDLEIVCERFTTSKLRQFEDLSTIATYGFRGEALASISHVAHVLIQSKTSSDKCAYRANYEDGKLKDPPVPIAGNQGTTIIVEDLFYNMNIRKRALRSAPEEYQKISDVVGKYAIHNAKVGFALKKQGTNNDIRTPPNSNQVDNIRTIYGNIIARELIEICMENDAFNFKIKGSITNVNYSAKKFVFLLFINHRLVECQSLKKCIDQIYSTYLPKNTHPFVYLSLELDSRDVDVNVHPTKHEVHFLHEDQIIELVATELETKLLGSNNSRVFYIQSKLPVLLHEEIAGDKHDKSVKNDIYDKNLVRTDATEQKLEKFFGAPTTKSHAKEKPNKGIADESLNEAEFNKYNEQFLENNVGFEKRLASFNNSIRTEQDSLDIVPSSQKNISKNLLSKVKQSETQLLSVLQLRKGIEDNCHLSLRELFSQHVFVGSANAEYALVQYSTKLYICNTQKLMQELFYQFIMYNFQNHDFVKLTNPLPVLSLAKIALDLPETGWTPDDGDKEELAAKIVEVLTEKREMLLEYFSLEIDGNGMLKALPLLLENHKPEVTGLPMYVLRLATEVDWETEKECFETFARETASYYSKLDPNNEDGDWKWIVEHVFYSAIKGYFLPPKHFTENAAVLQIADLPNLYKVFERC